MNPAGAAGFGVGPRTRAVVYGTHDTQTLVDELMLITQVDKAHIIMLGETGMVPREASRLLLRCIEAMRADNFQILAGRPAPRGLFMMYEGHLIDQLGSDVGGVLHTGRSRNDLNATTALLRLRSWLVSYSQQMSRFEAVLLNRARTYQSTVMPIYTHFQPAMPTTYGHYLLGITQAVGRAHDHLLHCARDIGTCPLGAGAVMGTDLAIDTTRTAELLGFDRPVGHATDAVASRDTHLRVLGAAAELTLVLSRLATDLQQWSTSEFDLIRFPDRLVGGSSAMPQKRNAFVLEHLTAKPGAVTGAWTACAATTAATPFTNSIQVGTEATASAWPGLAAAHDAVLLAQVAVSGAKPNARTMSARAAKGFTTATAIANQLVRQGVPFRDAHTIVGRAVGAAVASGAEHLGELDFGQLPAVPVDTAVSPQECVTATRYGGGPGTLGEMLSTSANQWRRRRARTTAWCKRLASAATRLHEAEQRMLDHDGRTG
jgi:argininosuccinate lyase